MSFRHARSAFLLCLALAACDEPAEPDMPGIDTAYLLDRVNGEAPPEPVCQGGAVEQTLEFESVALRDDDTYGRAQVIRIDGGAPLQQEEEGDFVRTDSTILLINAADDTLTLTLLDDDGDFVRRVHACGDTLRYESVPVGDAE